MMRNAVLPVLLFLCASAASAAGPSGQVSAFLTQSSLDTDVGDDNGNGFGIKGWFAPIGGFFVNGEYQTTALDDFDIDLESLRVGGGYYHALTEATGIYGYAEYVDLGADADEDGFGVHGGVHHQFMPQFGIDGTLGYLSLNETDGLEASFEAMYNFTKSWGAFAGFRTYMGDSDFGDFTVTDIRVGGTLTIGGM